MAQVSLQEVPQAIRDWFGSEDTVEFLIDLNQRIGVDVDGDAARIIPHLLYRLETKDIDPLHFIDQVQYWLQIPREQAASIVSEIKEKLLNPIREQLNKFSMNISLIDVTHAKPLADILPHIHANPRPPSAAYLARKAQLKKAPEIASPIFKDKLTVVEERLKKEMEPTAPTGVPERPASAQGFGPLRQSSSEASGAKKGPVIKINPTLLGLQRRPDQREGPSSVPPERDFGRAQREQDGGGPASVRQSADFGPLRQSSSEASEASKPFMLFGEEPEKPKPAVAGRKGFSMPFGFFNKDSGLRTKETNTNTKSRMVDYSGGRERVTPFAKEEEVFTIKDSKEISNFQFPISNKLPMTNNQTEIKTPLEKMFQAPAKPANGNGAKDAAATPKPVLEAPPSDGEVSIKKNPFAFPTKPKESDGKPKIDGNVVHL